MKGKLQLLLVAVFCSISLFSQTNGFSFITKQIVGYKSTTPMCFINDSMLYKEGWDNLAQPLFWKDVMNMQPDSAIVNLGSTRQILDCIDFKWWNKLSEVQKLAYKDSIRLCYNIEDASGIFITQGRKDYYRFKDAMPYINTAVNIFKQNNVDPWYAQAILLIESPGRSNLRSCVGAMGPFQLMSGVARSYGLKVNKKVDERTSTEKSALAACKLVKKVCIPYVKNMLDKANLTYTENDIWFRLLVLHTYHAGAGNVAAVLNKISPSQGGIDLIKNVWQTTHRNFQNSSQNYSQIALAALLKFDKIIMESDSVYLVDGDRYSKLMADKQCTANDQSCYINTCISQYEEDLLAGDIPFDYFITKVKALQQQQAGLSPENAESANHHKNYNDIAYQLLKAKRAEEASKLFKMCATTQPDSWSVYYGLGESYRLMGKKAQAIQYYKKSIKLNPDATESQRAIAKLTRKR